MKHILIVLILMMTISVGVAHEETLTIYSGRSESLIAPLVDQFTAETGIQVEVLYGSTAAMAAQILEEGGASPADVFIAQDAGALGALAKNNILTTLSNDILGRVTDDAFVSADGVWVGISGRARVFVYDPNSLEENGLTLPDSILDLTDEAWRGNVGWAPTNGSFQANITAMRVLLGDDATAQWLAGMIANDVQVYEKNTPIVQAVINGEIVGGLVNHYYLYRFLAEDPSIEATLHFFPGGDAGSLVNVAGASILQTSDQPGLAQRFILYLLSEVGQTYFATETYEYPLVADVDPSVDIIPLTDIEVPAIDLTDIDDLAGTLTIIEDSGALDG